MATGLGLRGFSMDTIETTNKSRKWVPAIPWAVKTLRYKCQCGQSYWTLDGYKGHYALKHILGE